MLCRKTFVSPFKIGLVALALTVGSTIALTGPTSSPAFAASGGGGGGNGGSGGSGGMSGGGSSSGGSGGMSSSGSSHSSGSEAPIICNTKKGWVYSKKKDMCVHASLLDDKELYQQGRALAVAGYYDDALVALDAVRVPDSMTLTMIGYSTRKLGNYDAGLAYYAKALALNSSNVNTHEYLGEAYAEKGKLDLAKAELVKVAAVCGTDCEQYEDLVKAIAGEPAD